MKFGLSVVGGFSSGSYFFRTLLHSTLLISERCSNSVNELFRVGPFEHEFVGLWRYMHRRDTPEPQIEIMRRDGASVVGCDVVPVGMRVTTERSEHVMGTNCQFDRYRTEVGEFEMFLS